jgi:ABC-type multidrug transport system ATPase subunit
MKIELQAVSKSYEGKSALDRASFEVTPGQIVAVLGANGAGKTTLLRCLAGLVGPDRGLLLFDDEPFQRDRLDMRRKIAFLPDFPMLFWEMSVIRHLGMLLRLYEAGGPGIEEKLITLLRDFDLLPVAETPLQNLSRGQAYKAALVGLIAVDADLWLLDEPFASGMDPHGINAFKRHAREAAKAGKTILYSTQILEVVERFSDRVCILDHGEVRAFDTVSILNSGGSRGDGLHGVFEELRETNK